LCGEGGGEGGGGGGGVTVLHMFVFLGRINACLLHKLALTGQSQVRISLWDLL